MLFSRGKVSDGGFRWSVTLALLVALTGCTSEQVAESPASSAASDISTPVASPAMSPPSTPPGPLGPLDATSLAGNTYVVTGGSEAWLPDVAPSLEITDPSRYAVLGLCNVLSGEYRIEGSTFVVSSMASTLAGCYEPEGSQLDWAQRFFLAPSTIGTVDGELVISNSLGYVVMAEQS